MTRCIYLMIDCRLTVNSLRKVSCNVCHCFFVGVRIWGKCIAFFCATNLHLVLCDSQETVGLVVSELLTKGSSCFFRPHTAFKCSTHTTSTPLPDCTNQTMAPVSKMHVFCNQERAKTMPLPRNTLLPCNAHLHCSVLLVTVATCHPHKPEARSEQLLQHLNKQSSLTGRHEEDRAQWLDGVLESAQDAVDGGGGHVRGKDTPLKVAKQLLVGEEHRQQVKRMLEVSRSNKANFGLGSRPDQLRNETLHPGIALEPTQHD